MIVLIAIACLLCMALSAVLAIVLWPKASGRATKKRSPGPGRRPSPSPSTQSNNRPTGSSGTDQTRPSDRPSGTSDRPTGSSGTDQTRPSDRPSGSDDRRPLPPLSDMKTITVNQNQQSLIDLLLAGKAVGSGRSIGPFPSPMGPGTKVALATKEDIEKSLAATSRTSNDNFFKEPTLTAIRTYGKSCTDTVWDCTNTIAQGTPVWLWPVGESDPEESSFMNGLLDRAKACSESATKKCLVENKPYAFDLDDYGPPRIQRALGKILVFLQDMRREAHVYVAKNAEEEGMRKTLAENPQWETLRIRLYSENKRRRDLCGGGMACSGGVTEGVYLPSFPDPEKDLYVLLHEVGHAFRGLVGSFRSSAIPWSTCEHGSDHDDLWHRCCVFLSNMARRVLARRGIVQTKGDYKQVMKPWEGYHKCYLARGMPPLDDPE